MAKKSVPEVITPEPTTTETPGLDGFNMADFTVNPSEQPIIVKKKIITLRVGKPNKQKFFRTVGGSDGEVTVRVLEIKEDGEYYLVLPKMLPYLIDEVKIVRLNLAYYMDGVPFIIPVPLPDSENPSKWNSWHRSLDSAVKASQKGWVRAIPDNSTNGYILMEAQGEFECPPLPDDMNLAGYLSIAFKDHIIDSLDHPIVKQLRGQM